MNNKEEKYQYLSNIIAHENWHIEQSEELTEDLSCFECHPVIET